MPRLITQFTPCPAGRSSLLLLGAFLLGVAFAPAASVGPSGYTNAITGIPAAVDFSTRSVGEDTPAAFTDSAALDAAVIANTSSSAITTVLGSSSTTPPSVQNIARYNATLGVLQERANVNSYTLLLATLTNNTGSNVAGVTISYDYVAYAGQSEEVPGQRVFFSMTGAAGSWTNLPALSGVTNSGRLSATVDAGAWTDGTAMYFLWADDNGSGTDNGYTLDNFSIQTSGGTAATAGPPPVASSVVTLVPTGAVWKYLDNGSDQGAAWRSNSFDDTTWASGPAQLGYGDGDEATVVGYGPTASAKYITTYFRRFFSVTNAASATNLLVRLKRDDGAVVFLNGTEIVRDGLATGQNYLTTATAASDDGANFYPFTVSPSALVEGINLLAVEVHQSGGGSSDISFDLELIATNMAGPLLTATVTQPANGAVFSLLLDSSLLLAATVTTNLTAVTNVEFFQATALLGNDSTAPYNFTWNSLAAGAYVLRAVAADASGARATSAPVSITLVTNFSPLVSLTSPTNGASFPTATNLTLTATASDADGTVANVQFYSGGALLGADNSSPFTFDWSNISTGNYVLTAVATDNAGTRGTSAPVAISVAVNQLPTVAITSPANNSSFLTGGSTTINVTAADADGSVTNVDFFDGAVKLGQDNTSPFSFVYNSLTAGAHLLRAVATDNQGATNTSALVTINVSSATVIRGPYLQMGRTNRAIVQWRSSTATDGFVFYGTNAVNLNLGAVEAMVTNNHIVLLTNLQPDTKYYYSVGTSNGVIAASTNYYFTTPPLIGTPKPTRVWVLGDAGTAGSSQASVRNAYQNYAATNGRSDLILMLGDNAYGSGSDTEYQGAVFNMYTNQLPNTFLYACLGNHDAGTPGIPMFDIFSFPQSAEMGGAASGTEYYYSFDVANIHVVVLDSMVSSRAAGSPMLTWLAADLAATTQPWIIALWHHPSYTRGSHTSDTEGNCVQMRQNVNPILEAYGVDLVLSGHSHCYERSFLIKDHFGLSTSLTPAMKLDAGSGRAGGTGAYQKTGTAGTVYTVAGSSGSTGGGLLNHPAMYQSFNTLGSMVLEFASNRLDAVFLDTTTTVLDRFTIVKDPQTDLPAAPASLAASLSGSAQIVLGWSNNATNETGYRLERSLDAVHFTEIATLGANHTNFTNNSLAASTTYFYRGRATNSLGASEFSNVAGASTPGPVVIGVQPQSLTNLVGGTANFSVIAGGTAPLSWQWRFNGTDLPGETNSTLSLANVQNSHGGPYTVRLTNPSGSVTSAVAVLTINHAPTALDTLASTQMNQPLLLETAKLLTTASDPDGDTLSIAAVSAASTNGGSVVLGTTSLTYTPVNNFVGADLFTYTISDGRGGTATAAVRVQVDSGVVAGGNLLPLIVTSNGFLVRFAGIPGRSYQLQRSAIAPVLWTTLASVLTATNGIGQHGDTNPPASGAFYRTTYP